MIAVHVLYQKHIVPFGQPPADLIVYAIQLKYSIQLQYLKI